MPPPVPPPPPDTADNAHDAQRSVRLMVGVSVGAVAIVIALIVTAVVMASRVQSESPAVDTGPLAVAAAPQPGAEGRWCTALDAALPDDVAGLARRDLLNPSAGVAAWGSPATILRCGLPDPAELTCSSPLTQFTDASGASVSWLHLSDESGATYIAVDRPVRIALTLPSGTGVGPVQQLSTIIAAAIPARPVCDGLTVTPPDNG